MTHGEKRRNLYIGGEPETYENYFLPDFGC